MATIPCGGCQGLGAHQRLCTSHPDYHPWKRLAQMAEDIGDTIGGNDTGIANQAYSLAGQIRALIAEHQGRKAQAEKGEHTVRGQPPQ